jgi:hypothetical protein
MSFNDMEMTTSSISTGLGRHQFELTQLLEFNMNALRVFRLERIERVSPNRRLRRTEEMNDAALAFF